MQNKRRILEGPEEQRRDQPLRGHQSGPEASPVKAEILRRNSWENRGLPLQRRGSTADASINHPNFRNLYGLSSTFQPAVPGKLPSTRGSCSGLSSIQGFLLSSSDENPSCSVVVLPPIREAPEREELRWLPPPQKPWTSVHLEKPLPALPDAHSDSLQHAATACGSAFGKASQRQQWSRMLDHGNCRIAATPEKAMHTI